MTDTENFTGIQKSDLDSFDYFATNLQPELMADDLVLVFS